MRAPQRVAVIAATFVCSACGALDSYRSEQKAQDAVKSLLVDPSSAQFRNLTERSGYVCGEVNAKNKVGAFVGFKRFMVSMTDWAAVIDPESTYSDLLRSEELCSSLRANEYSSLSTTESACSDAAEKRRSALEQEEFDGEWADHCGPSVRHPFQPELKKEIMNVATETNDAGALPADSSTVENENASESEPPLAPDADVAGESINDDEPTDSED